MDEYSVCLNEYISRSFDHLPVLRLIASWNENGGQTRIRGYRATAELI